MPIQQRVAIMDVKVQKAVTDATSASADLQDVTSSVALNYHVIPDKANVVYQTLGIHFKERIIDPAIQEVMKAVSARYTAEELITKRAAVSEAMRENLAERLMPHNIALDLIELRKVEANLKAIEKWNGILPQVTGGGAVPFIGVGEIQKR